jgi:hypothetical protein
MGISAVCKITALKSKNMEIKKQYKKSRHLHSPNHLLADELSKKMNEPKRFGFYLKTAEKHNHNFLRKIAGEVLEGNAKNKGALFTYLLKKDLAQENKQS